MALSEDTNELQQPTKCQQCESPNIEQEEMERVPMPHVVHLGQTIAVSNCTRAPLRVHCLACGFEWTVFGRIYEPGQ